VRPPGKACGVPGSRRYRRPRTWGGRVHAVATHCVSRSLPRVMTRPRCGSDPNLMSKGSISGEHVAVPLFVNPLLFDVTAKKPEHPVHHGHLSRFRKAMGLCVLTLAVGSPRKGAVVALRNLAVPNQGRSRPGRHWPGVSAPGSAFGGSDFDWITSNVCSNWFLAYAAANLLDNRQTLICASESNWTYRALGYHGSDDRLPPEPGARRDPKPSDSIS
jgi:hypothetical protein